MTSTQPTDADLSLMPILHSDA